MKIPHTALSVDDARAEALFCSDLSCRCANTADEVRAAIRAQVTARGGSRGCAGEVAYEYGRHPDTAPGRMAWARGEVTRVFHPATAVTPVVAACVGLDATQVRTTVGAVAA